jgi:hypothetical protein
MADQPTAEHTVRELEPLVGTWTLEGRAPGGPPWPGDARVTFEWMEGNQLLIGRSTVKMPDAPGSICVIGCDAANGSYTQLYTDERGVCRVYEMSIGDGEWRLWRDGEPFDQRFAGHFSDDGTRIDGRWEKKLSGAWVPDFDLTYTQAR